MNQTLFKRQHIITQLPLADNTFNRFEDKLNRVFQGDDVDPSGLINVVNHGG